MTILVDAALWTWRGRRWAHMVSDADYAELHRFAQSIGKRRLAFQGDHYDVDQADRSRAIAAGARAVDSRELLERLRAGGLRRRDPWRLVERGSVATGDVAARLRSHELPPTLVGSAASSAARLGRSVEMTVLERDSEIGVGLQAASILDPPVLDDLEVAEVHVWPGDGRPLVELIVPR